MNFAFNDSCRDQDCFHELERKGNEDERKVGGRGTRVAGAKVKGERRGAGLKNEWEGIAWREMRSSEERALGPIAPWVCHRGGGAGGFLRVRDSEKLILE